jgi:hypothetical protein
MKDKKKSTGFSHFILTRFNNGIYDREDSEKWMSERIKLFEATKKSVLSQKVAFKWILSFDSQTPDKVISEIITDDRMIPTTMDVRDYFKQAEIDTEFVITSRMDNDDLYLPGALKAIQLAFQPQVYVIDIDYKQYDMVSGDYYTSGNQLKGERFRERPTSPFLSLVEPATDIRTCYCRPHNKLTYGYPDKDGGSKIPAKKIRKQLAVMVIHSENMANKITGYKL